VPQAIAQYSESFSLFAGYEVVVPGGGAQVQPPGAPVLLSLVQWLASRGRPA
jgi:hypothetical protein